MRYLSSTFVLIASVLALAGAPTQAATLYDFTGSSPASAASPQFDVGGLVVTVTGGGAGANPIVTQTTDGLGVTGSNDGNGELDSRRGFSPFTTIPIVAYSNSIAFAFGEDVALTQFTFGAFDSNDEYGITIDGIALGGGFNSQTTATFDATGFDIAARTGRTFRVHTLAVVPSIFNPFGPVDEDSFRVANLTVERLTVVPVSATAWMAAPLLAGLGVINRRHPA